MLWCHHYWNCVFGFIYPPFKDVYNEILTPIILRDLGRAIADVMLDEISVEGKLWEKSGVVTASVKSVQLLNPCNNQIMLLTKKVCVNLFQSYIC